MNKPYIFAETAFIHEGDISYMKEMITEASTTGIDAIKFQVLINFEELISVAHPAHGQLRKFVFSEEQWEDIIETAIGKNLQVVIMPLDSGAFALVNRMKNRVRFLELHSVSFNDSQVKERIKASGVDLILSVGGRTQHEIQEAIDFFGDQLKVLMVGFQAFPSKIEDIRIRKILSLKTLYPDRVIGYADHSGFDDVFAIQSNSLAYCLGARIFEKHFTLAEGEKRTDFDSAIGSSKLKEITKDIHRLVQIVDGYENDLELSDIEIAYRNRQKMVVASADLRAGTVLEKNNLSLKMVGRFDGYAKIHDLLGLTILDDIAKDNIIKPENVGK